MNCSLNDDIIRMVNKDSAIQGFVEVALPQCLSVIDYTHVEVNAPEHGHEFYNQKHYCSMII